MLDALYKAHESMTVANGYNYTWGTLKSIGNGSLATKTGLPVYSVVFGEDEGSPEAGQSLYFLSNTITIIGQVEYPATVELEEQDYEVQLALMKMKQDLRKAFGYVSNDMCVAGIRSVEFQREVQTEKVSGHIVSCGLEMLIKWREERGRA